MKYKLLFKMMLLVTIFLILLTACTPREEPEISLYINETGEKKQIKLEEYLAGVVAAEMQTNWPENALAAQAILARTFTLSGMERGTIQELHGTDASTCVEEFQADNPAKINDRVRKAVQTTRGQVIKYEGQYVKAWYSACCGGVTAGAQEGLGWTKTETPYIQAGLKCGCLEVTAPENKGWVAKIPLSQARVAAQELTGSDPGEITTFEIPEWGFSGRAVKIKLGAVTMSMPEFRLAIGSKIIRSTLLTGIEITDGHLVITGDGFGHGVGMCQWGAYKMAQQGKSAEEIIRFYYHGVDIEKLWD